MLITINRVLPPNGQYFIGEEKGKWINCNRQVSDTKMKLGREIILEIR